MALEYNVKKGDLFPDVITTVRDEAGAVVDVTSATIKFTMWKAREPATIVINLASGDIMDGPNGKIRYQWQAGNTNTVGAYEGVFQVSPPGGDAFKVPTDGVIVINVQPSGA